MNLEIVLLMGKRFPGNYFCCSFFLTGGLLKVNLGSLQICGQVARGFKF